MSWENKASEKTLRLVKREGNLYYEVCHHIGLNTLFIECINEYEGIRVYEQETTAEKLLKEFSGLKKFASLLYCYEKIIKRDKEIQRIKNEYTNLRDDFFDKIREIDKLTKDVEDLNENELLTQFKIYKREVEQRQLNKKELERKEALIEEFVSGHYFSDDEKTIKWEPFENYDYEWIGEQILNDVESLKEFINGII